MSSAATMEPLAEDAVRLDTDPNPLKRKSPPASSPAPERQSESPKRAKTEQERVRTDDAYPDAGDREEPPKRSLEEARARVAQEEKRRSRRLFGGLMGALSQRPTGSQQQRRQEIEKRQQERLREQKVVERKAMEEKRAKLEDVRVREAIKWEERVLHVRHSTLQDQARFLRTKARPPLYYKPWILTADQKDEIRRQVYAAEDTIERERDDFQVRKEEHARRYGLTAQPEEGGEAAEPTDTEKLPEATKESDLQYPVLGERSEPRSTPDGDHHDESGDVVVEGGEDVVIY